MATGFGFSFGKMPKAGGKRLTNRTIGRYNVKTLGLKGSENKNGKRNTKQEALKAAPDSVSAKGEEEAFRSLSNGIFVNF